MLRFHSFLLALALPCAGFAQGTSSGGPVGDERPPADGGVTELEVLRGEGGYFVELPSSPSVDGGTPGSTAPASAPPESAVALVPPELVRDSPASYPPELAKAGLAGEVQLDLLVDEAGEVAEAIIVESPHPLFGAAALHAATRLRFHPATLNGERVPVRIRFSYRFEALPPREPPRDVTTVQGVVRTKGTRRPIPGAAVMIDGLELFVETDAEGRFTVHVPPGPRSFRVSAPGHRTRSVPEDLRRGETVTVIYALDPLRINPYETIVRGDRERTEVSRLTLGEAEIREVPGTMGDPFRVVMLLPGVSAMASGIAYPVVRGTQPSSTGYYLDGIRVPLLFHLFLGPAVVHPDFIDAIDFYPGVPPPEYGRLLGGVIDGKISRPRDGRLHATAYADVINAGGFVEQPIEATGTNFTAAGRVSYTAWLLALGARLLARDGAATLDFYDYQARLEQKLGEGRRLRLFAFGSSDLVAFRQPDVHMIQSVGFHRADVRYAQAVGLGELSAGVTWGIDRLGSENGSPEESFAVQVDQESYAAYARYEQPLGDGTMLVAGADVDHKRARLSTSAISPRAPRLTVSEPTAIATLAGAYAQVIWKRAPGWTLIPGLRLDNYHLVPGVNHFVVEPRITARRPLTEALTFKAGFGVFHQAPAFLISAPVVDLLGLKLGTQEGLQFDAGIEWQLPRRLELNVDAYFNPLLRSVELNFLDPQPQTEPSSDVFGRSSDLIGSGYAWGLEVLLRHPLGDNWFGWLSYSLQHSARYLRLARTNEYGEFTGAVRGWVDFAFDQTHVLNAVLSYRFEGGWTVGAVLHFNTGRPETGERYLGIDRLGSDSWLDVDRDRVGRLPAFLRLDTRVARAFAFDDFQLEVYADVLNVIGSSEVVSYRYLRDDFGRPTTKVALGIPIVVPILGVKARY
jgi:TonB family protein